MKKFIVNNFITINMRGKVVIGVVILIAMLFSSIGFGFASTNAGDSAKNSTEMRDLNSGLVAYWNFDEGSGNVLHDVSGNGNDGTIYNATWVSGIHVKALSFNGNGDYVEVDSNLLNQLPLTISGWVKPELRNDYDYTTQFPNNVISNDYPGNSGMGFGVNMWGHTTMITVEYQGHIGKNKSFVRLTNTSFMSDTWHFVAVTYTISNFWLYIDGKEIYHLNFTQDALDGVNYIRIGKHNDDSYRYATTRFFKGAIDELRIYNRALSADEIKALYYQYVLKAPGNLQADMGRKWIELHWDAPDNTNSVGLSGYDIYRSEDGINYEKIGESTETNYNDTSVVEGRTYHYYVIGKNANGIEGDKSENLKVNLVFPPTSPQNLNAGYKDGKVILSWDKPTDDGGVGIDGYTIYRSEDGVNYKKIGVTAGDTTKYYDEKVDNGKTYYYYITATNRVGESEKSNIAKISTPNPFPWLWIILGLIIAAIVIGVALLMARKKKRTPASTIPPQQVQQPPPQQTQPPQYQQTGYPPPSSQGGFVNKTQPPLQTTGMITVTCPYCGFTSQMPENMRGQWVQCPKCGNRFQVQ